MACADVIVMNGHRDDKEDIYDGITNRLENMLCYKCHELKPLRVLPCPKKDLFCESCMDWQFINKTCTSCFGTFTIPPGGVSKMVNDVTHEQIKDVLDSLCTLRVTNCPVCALDDSHAKLASKVYKYSVQESVFVCANCRSQCQKDLQLEAYNCIPVATTSQPTAPLSTLQRQVKVEMEVTNSQQDTPAVPNKQLYPNNEMATNVTTVNGHDSSSEEDEEDQPDSKAFTTPHPVSPSSSTLSERLDLQTPPPAYDSHSGSPDNKFDKNITVVDPPLMSEAWECKGKPFSRANDAIFLPTDDSVIVTDWYSGEVHKFDSNGTCTASKLLKHSPWSFVKQRSQGPWSVAYSPSQNSLFVTEIGLPTICKMSPTNLEVEKKRIQLNGVQNPAGIAFLNNGQLVMTEDVYRGTHRVAIYDLPTGMNVMDWQCTDPQLVCVDNHDRIIVSNHSDNCVEVFDTTGRIITSFGKGGDNPILKPMGVASDEYGNIYATHEVHNGYKLSMWSPEGRYIAALKHWDRAHMNLLDLEIWHMRSVDVHGNRLALLGRRTLQVYKLKGLG